MFGFARRPKQQNSPLGAPGLSQAEYDRITARLRKDRGVRAVRPASRPEVLFATATYEINAQLTHAPRSDGAGAPSTALKSEGSHSAEISAQPTG